jgi:hypothetical protein
MEDVLSWRLEEGLSCSLFFLWYHLLPGALCDEDVTAL